MKALNNLQFITNATLEMKQILDEIANSDSVEIAKKNANRAFGFCDCMTTYLNCMICTENNDFTAGMDAMLDSWMDDIYQHIAYCAIEHGADAEEVCKILKARDEYRKSAIE